MPFEDTNFLDIGDRWNGDLVNHFKALHFFQTNFDYAGLRRCFSKSRAAVATRGASGKHAGSRMRLDDTGAGNAPIRAADIGPRTSWARAMTSTPTPHVTCPSSSVSNAPV